MKAQIHSIKHYVHQLKTTVASGGTTGYDLVDAVAEGAARANTFSVNEGNTVKAIYVELWVSGASVDNTVNCIVVKIPGTGANPTFTEMNNLGSYENKKNILEAHQGLTSASGTVIPMLRHWIKIPRGKQRMGQGDRIAVRLSATGAVVNFCGIATFKEYD